MTVEAEKSKDDLVVRASTQPSTLVVQFTTSMILLCWTIQATLGELSELTLQSVFADGVMKSDG